MRQDAGKLLNGEVWYEASVMYVSCMSAHRLSEEDAVEW